MNLIILFWLNRDNFAGVIPGESNGCLLSPSEREDAIRKWESDHDYNPNTILETDYYMEIL